MKTLLQKILAILARMTIKKYKPMVIGVTGSVGKTSAKTAIFTILSKKYNVRMAEKNYNTEIGFPLAILGIKHCGRNVPAWLWAIIYGYIQVIIYHPNYPKVLVLEYGIDKPGDMDYLLSIARPSIAVVTAIGDIPVHVEFFKDPGELVQEKAKLILSLTPEGHAVLDHDDYAVYDMKEKTGAKTLSYGFEEHAEVRITNYVLRLRKDEKLGDVPKGVGFKIEYRGDVVPFHLAGSFGYSQAYTAAAAAAVGIIMGMNLVEIAEEIKKYLPPPGRLRLLGGIKHSYILDDTYNASPEAMRLALDTLRDLPGRRKIAVLGDMRELGRYMEQAHLAIGDQAAQFIDLLFTVGPAAKFIAHEALARGIKKNGRVLSHNQVFMFDDSMSAGKALQPKIQEGDLILVKGSQAMRMEKAVEEIMRYPENADKLLVRQDAYWKNR